MKATVAHNEEDDTLMTIETPTTILLNSNKNDDHHVHHHQIPSSSSSIDQLSSDTIVGLQSNTLPTATLVTTYPTKSMNSVLESIESTTSLDLNRSPNSPSRHADLSSKLLHEAFLSLSLSDKCALSLSLNQLQNFSSGSNCSSGSVVGGDENNLQNSPMYNNNSHHHHHHHLNHTYQSETCTMNESDNNDASSDSISSRNRGVGRIGSGGSFTINNNNYCSSSSSTSNSAHSISSGGHYNYSNNKNNNNNNNFYHTNNIISAHNCNSSSSCISSTAADDLSEIHSVLSESDIESLDVAISMMGQFELQQLENEVKLLLLLLCIFFFIHLCLNLIIYLSFYLHIFIV